MSAEPRVLALADSDSYLKWAAATLGRLAQDPGACARTRVALVRSPLLPTEAQVRAAMRGAAATRDLSVLGPRGVRSILERWRPDVVLVATTGPLAELLIHQIRRERPRPAILSGLPGIGLPATARVLDHRAGADALVVHSRTEQTAYDHLAAGRGRPVTTVLTRLPFAADPPSTQSTALPDRVVFAAQSLVPATRSQRMRILGGLAGLARAHSGLDVVVKLRADSGERQTHNEALPYDRLWAQWAREAGLPPGLVRFCGGSMGEWLVPGVALVTVSSTAALESVGLGLPTMVLTDFGVSDVLLNAPFVGSGLMGTLDDLAALRFGSVEPAWLQDNWFHPEPSALPDVVIALTARARDGWLPREVVPSSPRQARTWLRSALPVPVTRLAGLLSG